MLHLTAFRSWVVVAVVMGLVSCSHHPAAGAGPVSYTVSIDGSKFVPETVTVHPGDSIVWTNTDPFPHTVTSQAGGFDSKEFGPGTSWTYVASKTGTFPYVCTLHRTMKGTLRVEQ